MQMIDFSTYIDNLKSELDMTLGRVRKTVLEKNSSELVSEYLMEKILPFVQNPEKVPAMYKEGSADGPACHLLLKGPGYSLMTMVYLPGQGNMPHNHLTPGAIGVLEGFETEQKYTFDKRQKILLPNGAPTTVAAGYIGSVYPDIFNEKLDETDWHSIKNMHDKKAVSVHLYAQDYSTFYRQKYVDKKLVAYTSTFMQSSGLANLLQWC